MIVDGKLVADKLKERLKERLKHKSIKDVSFVVFGNNPASDQFVRMKCRFAESLNIKANVIKHEENLSFEEAKKIVEKAVLSGSSGVVVQLPLPFGWPIQEMLNLIPPELDIDMLSEFSKIEYIKNNTEKEPPVSRAVREIFNFYNIDTIGKKILVIGSGRLVGEPVCMMFKKENIMFDVIDKDTDSQIQKNLISSADIIISGAGSSHMIIPDMIKDGVVLIDAGTSEQNGKVVGDVHPDSYHKASLVTPVPGGVGPVTLVSLFMNI